jgi:hypothetical protein
MSGGRAVPGIIEELALGYADVGKRYADIGVDLTLGACPIPHIAVHAQMQLLDELSREHVRHGDGARAARP